MGLGVGDGNNQQPLLISSSSAAAAEEEEYLGLGLHNEEEPECGSMMIGIWSESKKIWHIAGPSIFTRLAMFSITTITQAFAGHLSDLHLAALSIVTTVIIGVTFGFMLGMASALETLCGQAYGAKRHHLLGIYLQRSWIVLFLASISLLPLFLFAGPILKLAGQPTAVADLSGIVAMWLIPMHMSFAFQFSLVRFLQCQLKMAVIAWVSGGALALHVFVSWFFVYRLRVGIVGTALTLDFSWWVSVLGLFGYVVLGGCPHSWTGFSEQAFVRLWEFFKLSVASGVMLSLENFYYRVLIIVSGIMTRAEVAISALSICISIFAWESMIPLGFLAATGDFVSQIHQKLLGNLRLHLAQIHVKKTSYIHHLIRVRVANELGAGNAEGAKFASIVSTFTSLLVGIFFWVLIIACPDNLAMIFTSNTSVIRMVNELALLLAFTILLNCIQPVLSGVAIGSGWQAQVAIINIGSYYIVGVPLGIILGWLLNFGFKGLWVGMISGTVVQTLILICITTRRNWEEQVSGVHHFIPFYLHSISVRTYNHFHVGVH
ncbi:protein DETOXIFICATION 27-like isoform X2 [Diospyros lotus]|uniref:protein DETOXIFICATION 27-like isoform X2 n=1 Tax=Diospyros lotus TaxID=55363 RepID=UPI00225BED11|nr:protein DETOXIFICATION 27-like isoform X2 [Diospyros lotus]